MADSMGEVAAVAAMVRWRLIVWTICLLQHSTFGSIDGLFSVVWVVDFLLGGTGDPGEFVKSEK